MFRRWDLAPTVLAVVTLVACGGGGGASSDQSSTTAALLGSTTTAAPATTTTTAAAASTTTAGTAASTTTAAPTETTTTVASDGVFLELTAVDLLFSTDHLETRAGVETEVYFHHNDIEPHNFHVVLGGDPADDIVSVVLTAPAEDHIVFTIDEPGEYQYFCDTHPLDMHGTLVVNP